MQQETMARKNHFVELIEYKHRQRPFKQILQSRLDSGQSMREIAREWGLHYSSLYRLAKRYKVELPTQDEPSR